MCFAMSWDPPAPPLIKPEERPLDSTSMSLIRATIAYQFVSQALPLHGALQAQRQEDQRSLANTTHIKYHPFPSPYH